MNKPNKVIVIGAGPAGLFAAQELSRKGVSDILILEKGNSIEKRKKSETLYGVGGSGTFSDGKLHFSLNLSQEKLLDFCDRNEAQSLIKEVEQEFLTLGVKSPVTPTDKNAVKQLIKECQKFNVQLYDRRCRHVGSDLLPIIMKKMVNKLLKSGVKIKTKTEVSKILFEKEGFILESNKGEFRCQKLLVAPGRGGTKWFQDQAKELKIHYDYQKVEVGVRVEFPASVTEDHSRVMYENIYSLQTPTFDDTMRTFCPCPNGYVAIEDYGDYVCVNGHSNSNNDSPNSNFALVQEIKLTEPVENTTDYAISIAKLATTIGGGKPIIQRLMDLKKRRRSNSSRISKSLVTPSLTNCTPGDIAMALPYRLVTNILEALEILDQILPGINAGSNFLYAPEIKLRGSKIKTDKFLETEIKGLFVAGDGAGVSGNIVGAAATGIIAARGILKNYKK
ncbi:MAG TPA: FAD-dependent oxidoreductase [Candidatus Woesebacteria bacterium]|nr:FAD-dependent oxidoreductase [Candidatus Woesebacteria bacterium]HPR99215.1 FAD-dependent oxidoreductase [Candidatus Woesebacteria bacterium]